MEIRGIQLKSDGAIDYRKGFEEMTVDCDLGSLVISKEDLYNYLKNRSQTKEKPTSGDNPFCNNCLENPNNELNCAVSFDDTCAMIRAYQRMKKENIK